MVIWVHKYAYINENKLCLNENVKYVYLYPLIFNFASIFVTVSSKLSIGNNKSLVDTNTLQTQYSTLLTICSYTYNIFIKKSIVKLNVEMNVKVRLNTFCSNAQNLKNYSKYFYVEFIVQQIEFVKSFLKIHQQFYYSQWIKGSIVAR